MKKRVLLLLLCLLLCVCLFPAFARADGDRYLEINEANFPDPVFRQYVIDDLAGGKDYMTEAEVAAVIEIDVPEMGIQDLTGIEHFTELTGLYCQYNQLPSLNVGNCTQLVVLDCGGNRLTSLDVSRLTALEVLYCGENQLSSLDVSKNTALWTICCNDNQLTALDVSKNTALTHLSCQYNQLTSLNVGNCTQLVELDCGGNRLTSLDVSRFTALEVLYCGENQLSSLDVSKNTALWTICCNDNQLTALDVSKNTALKYLYCQKNSLATLNVTLNTALTHLYCWGNELTALNVSKNTKLVELCCGRSQIAALDVSRNTALTMLYCNDNQLTQLDVSKNTALENFDCSYNQLTALDISKNTKLKYLYCQMNSLSALNVTLNTALTHLYCWGNELTALNVSKNTKLVELCCGRSQIAALDVSRNTALTMLYCNDNQLTQLDVSKNTALKDFDCGSNQLSKLDLSTNTALQYLYCSDNRLTALTLGTHEGLSYVSCAYNKLKSLDLSGCTGLQTLFCHTNELTSLDLRGNPNLEELYCQENELSSLNLSQNAKLTYLACRHNRLQSLDLSNAPALGTLICYNNQLTTLDLSANKALGRTDIKQTIEDKTLTALEGGYGFDLAALVPLQDMERVTLAGDGVLDADTGMVTFAQKVDRFVYRYDTGRTDMEVTVVFGKAAELIAPVLVSCSPEQIWADAGETVILELYAEGANLTRTWYEKAPSEDTWTLLTEATSAAIGHEMMAGDNGYRYRCVAANQAGSVTMETTLWLNGAPSITVEPADLSAKDGETVSFAVQADGDDVAFRWQWRDGRTDVWTDVSETSGAANVYTFKAVASMNGRQYRCVVSNALGQAISKTAELTVTHDHIPGEPVIENEVPANCTYDGSYDEVVYCTVCGEVLSRENRIIEKSGEHVPGAPVRENEVKATTTTRGHYEEVVYCTVCGEELSREEKAINKSVKGLTITGEPEDAKVKNGEKAKFTVKISGKATAIQWYYRTYETAKWKKVSSKGNKLTLTVTGKPGNDGYQYRCELKNGKKKLYSDTVTLDVELFPPTISSQPESAAIQAGEEATFTFGVEGEGVTYAWSYRKSETGKWAAVKGGTGATLTVTGKADNAGYQYKCEAKNKDGSVTSDIVTLDVEYHLPEIVTPPKGVKVKKNAKVTFTVEANDPYEEELTFQWYYRKSSKAKWTKIKGATERTYSFKATAKKSGYQYKCDVTNHDGTVSTKAVTLKVK